MKFNKKFMSGALAALLLSSSLVMAAPATRNLVANYGVTLNVNGSNFTVSDDSMRPFLTQDGRTYVSIAALGQMGIATVNYIPASKTVQIKGSAADATGLQAQVNAQTAENSRLLNENNQLKAKIKELEGKKEEEAKKGDKLSDLSSSDRRSIERDLSSEIRSLRANSNFERGQRFDGDISIGTRDVTFNLYPYSGNYTANDIKAWNDLVNDRNKVSRLEEDYEDFMDEVQRLVASYLKGYSDYNVYVSIYSDQEMKSGQLMVEADYSYSKDRLSASVYEVK